MSGIDGYTQYGIDALLGKLSSTTPGSGVARSSGGAMIDNTSTLFPHLIATGGAGSVASPWTHSDNTGGIRTKIAAAIAAGGGGVELAPGRFSVTAGSGINSGVLIDGGSLSIRGQGTGFPGGANGNDESTAGVTLHCTHSGFNFTNVGVSARFGGITLSGIHTFGPPDIAGEYAAIACNGYFDQTAIDNFHSVNHKYGLYVKTGATLDGWRIGIDCLYDTFGIYFAGTGRSLYSIFEDGVYSDLSDGAMVFSADCLGNVINSNRFVRTNYSTGSECLRLAGSREVVTGNIFDSIGHDILHGTDHAADGISITGSDCVVAGNAIYGTQQGYGVHIRSGALRNVIAANNITTSANGNPGIVVDAGAIDTVIGQPNAVLDALAGSGIQMISDSGTRTIINGLSYNSGNPDAAGVWSSVWKGENLRIINTADNVVYWYSGKHSGHGAYDLTSSFVSGSRSTLTLPATVTIFDVGAREVQAKQFQVNAVGDASLFTGGSVGFYGTAGAAGGVGHAYANAGWGIRTPAAALADGELAVNEMNPWIDESGGTKILKVKCKLSGGTVMNGTLCNLA